MPFLVFYTFNIGNGAEKKRWYFFCPFINRKSSREDFVGALEKVSDLIATKMLGPLRLGIPKLGKQGEGIAAKFVLIISC